MSIHSIMDTLYYLHEMEYYTMMGRRKLVTYINVVESYKHHDEQREPDTQIHVT